MAEECKELEKKAKGLEVDNLNESIKFYKQAAECYVTHDKPKNRVGCLGKVAKLIREDAKSNDDPVKALEIFKSAVEVYNQIDKQSESEKVMNEAYKKLIDSAKNIRAEAKKAEDPDFAETQFAKASNYASRGNDDALSNTCWIDSGEQFKKKAGVTDDPRLALEVFKHAIQNFRKGGSQDLMKKSLVEAADKFNKRANEVEKSKKNLVLAIDGYVQASSIYKAANLGEKADTLTNTINDLCDSIGMPLEEITTYLKTQNLTAISL